MRHRIHVIGLPHTQTTKAYTHCAYTEKVRKFCNMMTSAGHDVVLYASEENEAKVSEHVVCITKEEQRELIGIETPQDNLKAEFNPSTPYWELFNKNVIEALKQNVREKDFICVIAGLCQKPIADAFPNNMTVEFGIGYGGTFSKYRVFESYAWMHMVYGMESGGDVHGKDGNFYDCVIPNYYDVDDFRLAEKKGDYFLFIGRMIERKGYKIAMEACRRMGVKLVFAGQGQPPEGYEYHGVVGPEERAKLMSEARGVFVPTIYVEPFGGVAVEAQLCGTPVITTDWGAFTETVDHGYSGFRCRNMQDFCLAIKNIEQLTSGEQIRIRAINNWSLWRVEKLYNEYFDRLYKLWGNGFYEVDQLADKVDDYGLVL